ncbi:hypothetical protein FRX31_018450 [Thalictrum thalictroides]|uniref:Uncharacterized protein n=1 Tax=Thalictrum thalictroides TaxID=46969 RepID=A0A7J6W4H2_THATH|nr:hypothetical protein FRX31_018450 [Thalictrum thalictroides]
MEYMPNGRKGGHKRGREEFSDDEDDLHDFATKRKKGTSETRIKVDFTIHGQAIGPNAAKYSTRLGCLTRTHCPPIYAEWSDKALNGNKDDLWDGIQHIHLSNNN